MIPYQILDVAGPLDILSSCSKEFIAMGVANGYPEMQALADKAIDIEFHYIGETMDPVGLTAGAKWLPSTTCDDCPPLDYLLVGGPDPLKYHLTERFSNFLRAHVNAGKVLFTTCTGALCVSRTGILDGLNATTNHESLHWAEKIRPQVKWTMESQWVVDGNIWTAGGACAGMDMFASWVTEKYGKKIIQLAYSSLDFEPRDIVGNRVLPQQHGVSTF